MSHSPMPSLSHALNPLCPLSPMPSLPYILTLPYPHFYIPSLAYNLTRLYPYSPIPSLSHTLNPLCPHSPMPSLSLSLLCPHCITCSALVTVTSVRPGTILPSGVCLISNLSLVPYIIEKNRCNQ